MTLRLPVEEKLALAVLADRRGQSTSELLREMIAVVLASESRERETGTRTDTTPGPGRFPPGAASTRPTDGEANSHTLPKCHDS